MICVDRTNHLNPGPCRVVWWLRLEQLLSRSDEDVFQQQEARETQVNLNRPGNSLRTRAVSLATQQQESND